MSLTRELVDLCYRVEPEAARPGDSVALVDDDYRALAERLDREAGTDPFWVFAYGSLVWKPAFEAAESRRATAFGWHRTFSLVMQRYRGSPTVPGLMMALSRGGRCDGFIFRLPDQSRRADIETLLRREMDDEFGASAGRWMTVRTKDGSVRAFGCWVGAKGRLIDEGRPFEQVADILARACGHVGSNAEYLFNTVAHLEAAGIHDRNLWRLQALLAARIRELNGLPLE